MCFPCFFGFQKSGDDCLSVTCRNILPSPLSLPDDSPFRIRVTGPSSVLHISAILSKPNRNSSDPSMQIPIVFPTLEFGRVVSAKYI